MKIEVIVKDKTMLELMSDAKKGDIIDLRDVVEIDSSIIEKLIDEGKDKVYQAKLADVSEKHKSEVSALMADREKAIAIRESETKDFFNNKIREITEANTKNVEYLKEEIAKKDAEFKALNDKIKDLISLKEKEIDSKYLNDINALKNEIDILNTTKKSDLESITKEYELKLSKEIDEKKQKEEFYLLKFEQMKEASSTLITNAVASTEKKYLDQVNELKTTIEKNKSVYELEKNKELTAQKEGFDSKIRKLEEEISSLKRTKAELSVKAIGEDLEGWCNSQMESYMQTGFQTCTWDKDNKVVKDEGESKGSKADYIFKVFATPEFNENEVLTSVCLDMKDEDPNSTNKKTNADHYKQLDNNRKKKNCKYAVLVSSLEADNPNILPIYKVREYEDMYVVRPAYMITFLNMITTLTQKFGNLILAKKAEDIKFEEKQELIEKFSKAKKTYLEEPLNKLINRVSDILSQSEKLDKVSESIKKDCGEIQRMYIDEIEKKIEKFEIELGKISKKMD